MNAWFTCPLPSEAKLAWGFLASWVVGYVLVTSILWWLKRDLKKAPHLSDPRRAAQWEMVITGNDAGAWIGGLERILFFVAFSLDENEIVAGWLALKVASKWEVWTNIVAVPTEVPRVDPIEYLAVRRKWASNVLATFLVGTITNVLCSFTGVALTRLWIAA